ncbi:MAG: TlpA disulfide reductase family protein [bacterium]|nr:TlpA disulfide reductase family protein [bacterium]
MRWVILIFVIVFDIGVLFYLFGDKITQTSDTTVRFSDIQDELLLVDYGGFKADLGVFASQPLVINSWASWCLFCKEELPAFATVQKEFSDQVRFIAINRRESPETAKKYTDELDITDDLIFLIDTPDSFYKAMGGFTMPETIFVDRAGNVVFHKRGVMTIDEIREQTLKIIHN